MTMTTTSDKMTTIDTNTSGLAEDVRESAKAGQHAASQALHKFRQTLDDAIPEAVQPLRTRIVDAAIELADELVTAQFKVQPQHRPIRGQGLDEGGRRSARQELLSRGRTDQLVDTTEWPRAARQLPC